MKRAFLSLHLLVLTILAVRGQGGAEIACRLLEKALPGSVFFPGSATYDADISHYRVTSTQNATCSVEPMLVKDISTILGIIGRDDIRSPFGIIAGGHAFNVGFSSTTGVEIALTKFTDVVYDPSTQTVKVQPGTIWDRVYAELEKYNVTVIGGRVPGIGVGGLALGGGYGWVTGQYGLTIDNIIAYDLVLPNGTFIEVTDATHPDIFFGLKGGLNNFGIVTTFTLKAQPLGHVWAGNIVYGADSKERVAAAVSNFSLQNTDPKAQINPIYSNAAGTSTWIMTVFYNGPTMPCLLQPFMNIPSMSNDVSFRSLPDFVSSITASDVPNARLISHTVPIIRYTPKIIDTIQTNVDAAYANAIAQNRSISSVVVVVEMIFGAFAHSTPSAYPHSPSRPVNPSNPEMTYTSAEDDEYFNGALWNMSNAIQAVAVEEGQSLWTDPLYPNYALGNTPLERMFGGNIPRLRAIKKKVDPDNVMGLAGGFKF